MWLEEALERSLLDLQQVRDVDDPRNAGKGLSDPGREIGECDVRHD
jgi:hypothetical protein